MLSHMSSPLAKDTLYHKGNEVVDSHLQNSGISSWTLRFKISWLDKTEMIIFCRLRTVPVLSALWYSHFVVVVQSLSRVQLFATPGLLHARLLCPSQSPGVFSNSSSLSWWCHPTISSSVIPFSSCLQSFPASGSFPVNWLFASGGQSIGASASASVLAMNIQDWFPLGWTGLISLQSKELSGVFSSTTIQKDQFFDAQFSLWFNSHIRTWLEAKS